MRTKFFLFVLFFALAMPAYSQIVIQPYDPYDAYPHSDLDYRWGGIYDGYHRLYGDELIDYLGYSTYGSEYMRAKSNVYWGFSLTAGGAAVTLFGIGLLSAILDDNRFSDENGLHMHSSLAAGIVPMAVGAACLGVGIPLWVRGTRQMRAMVDDYNLNHREEEYGSRTSVTVGPTRSGLGLALNF